VRRHGYMAVPADRFAAGEMNAAQQGVDAAVHALIVDKPAEGGHAYGKHDCQYRNGNHHLDQGEATAGHGADLLRKGATANAAREHGRSGYNPGPGRQSGLGDIWEGRHNGPAKTERPEVQWASSQRRSSSTPASMWWV